MEEPGEGAEGCVCVRVCVCVCVRVCVCKVVMTMTLWVTAVCVHACLKVL